jgi:hypothetical protein
MDHKSDQTKQIKTVVELEPMITYDDLCVLLVSTGFNRFQPQNMAVPCLVLPVSLVVHHRPSEQD